MTEQKIWKIEGADFEKIKKFKDEYSQKIDELNEFLKSTRKQLWSEIREILPETDGVKSLSLVDDFESAGLYIIKQDTNKNPLEKIIEELKDKLS